MTFELLPAVPVEIWLPGTTTVWTGISYIELYISDRNGEGYNTQLYYYRPQKCTQSVNYMYLPLWRTNALSSTREGCGYFFYWNGSKQDLPRWLRWLRHSAHRPGRSIGGAGGQFPGLAGRFRIRISGAHALRLISRAGKEGSTVSSIICDRWLILG